MPVLRKFMCCCQLATGAFVIGWVGLVFEIIGLAGNSAVLGNLDNMNIEEYAATAARVPLAITLACNVISIVSHICLLWGANVKNRLFLLPWLICTMIFIVATFFTVLILGIFLASASADGVAVACLFIFGFTITGIILYLWLCVLSLFQELRENADDGIVLTPPEYNSCPPYKMPVLLKFMCCCQLATGAVVIGWVGLVFEILGLAGNSAILAYLDKRYKEEYAAERTTLITLLVSHIISVVSHICLLWGANVKNRLFLLPWLISTMIKIVAMFFSVLIYGIVLISASADSEGVEILYIFGFSITGFILYWWMCVLSFFQELRESESNDDTAPKAPHIFA